MSNGQHHDRPNGFSELVSCRGVHFAKLARWRKFEGSPVNNKRLAVAFQIRSRIDNRMSNGVRETFGVKDA